MIIEALQRDLPPATLLLGPDLERLVKVAQWSAHQHGVLLADRIIARHVSSADARNIVRFAGTAPFGPFKLVIACLDSATPQAQNILLKVLEEPPPEIRFILAATSRPLPTIVSRCQVIIVPAQAGDDETGGKAASQVLSAIRAAAAGDLRALDKSLDGWGEAQHALLTRQLAEAASQQRDAAAQAGITRIQARRLLSALGRHADASFRLAAHAALVTVLDKEQRA